MCLIPHLPALNGSVLKRYVYIIVHSAYLYIIKVRVGVCIIATEGGGKAAPVITRKIPRQHTLKGRSSEADFVMPSKHTHAHVATL